MSTLEQEIIDKASPTRQNRPTARAGIDRAGNGGDAEDHKSWATSSMTYGSLA